MSERPFERHYGELRCRRYLFDPAPVPVAPQASRPEGAPAPSTTAPAGRDGLERPQ
jgi:hypothetical protein